jgi:hypothetical protein
VVVFWVLGATCAYPILVEKAELSRIRMIAAAAYGYDIDKYDLIFRSIMLTLY